MAEEDLIFGKNRHFFGGIEPANMKQFSVEIINGLVQLTSVLPDDTVIDGQTLCTIAGAVIRRKLNGFPKDEFDGDFVADITESMVYIDRTISSTDHCYYAAFPYTTQGVYSRSKNNRTSLNADAMIIQLSSAYRSAVTVSFTIPPGFSGVVVRKGVSGYPATETDGIEVGTYTSSGSFVDENLESDICLYALFPYDSEGEYIYDDRNRISVQVPKSSYIYGYDLVKSTSNPSTRVSYPGDVDNTGFTPAKMNFSSGKFEQGSWNLTPGHHFMPKPCMLKYDGTVSYYLNPNDYSKKEDGSNSDVANTGFGGNAMMEWPKIYTKRWEENGVYHFRCSDVKQGADWDCWCNYDRNDNIIEHFYTPIYFGSVNGGKLRSISGTSQINSYDATEEINYAKANGSDWYTEVLADRLLIQDLLVLVGKSTNGQSTFGSGRSSSSNTVSIKSGTMDTKGLFWGSNDQTSGVKVFGMENFWGNMYRRIAGWMLVSNTHKVKLTRGTHDGTTVSDYNTTGSGYLTAGSCSGSMYISGMSTNSFGRLPSALSGSSSTYECDYVYTSSGTKYACVGGSWSRGLEVGPFFADLADAASDSHTYRGASISCKPLAAT